MRRVWFSEGARALRTILRERGLDHQLPTEEDWYLCPLCVGVLFTIDELDRPDPELTYEHAPPAWSGGKEMALTCRSCNNKSGSLFDSEAQKEDLERRVLSGKTGDAMKVAYTIGGVTNYANMHMSGTTGMLLVNVPRANNPTDVQRITELMGSHAAGPDLAGALTLRIQPRMRINRNRARISWIRAAYIVAFASFGWRYILQPALDPLRAQFQNPDNITLPILSMWDPDADTTRRQV